MNAITPDVVNEKRLKFCSDCKTLDSVALNGRFDLSTPGFQMLLNNSVTLLTDDDGQIDDPLVAIETNEAVIQNITDLWNLQAELTAYISEYEKNAIEFMQFVNGMVLDQLNEACA